MRWWNESGARSREVRATTLRAGDLGSAGAPGYESRGRHEAVHGDRLTRAPLTGTVTRSGRPLTGSRVAQPVRNAVNDSFLASDAVNGSFTAPRPGPLARM